MDITWDDKDHTATGTPRDVWADDDANQTKEAVNSKQDKNANTIGLSGLSGLGFVKRTGAGTFTTETITPGGSAVGPLGALQLSDGASNFEGDANFTFKEVSPNNWELAMAVFAAGYNFAIRAGGSQDIILTVDSDGNIGFAGKVIGNVGNPVASSDVDTKGARDAAISAAIALLDAMVYKGVIDCSANPNYPAADAGFTYRVSVAGKIGGASGISVKPFDMLICKNDGTPSGNQATVGSNWDIIPVNDNGVVYGPISSTNGNLAVFDGVTGKLIADGGNTIDGILAAALSDAETYADGVAAIAESNANAYSRDLTYNNRRKNPVDVAVLTPLPSYNVITGGILLQLEAVANGFFPSQDGVLNDATHTIDSFVLVGETGANKKYNGTWDLDLKGSAGTKWLATRRPDTGITTAGNIVDFARVDVLRGTLKGGHEFRQVLTNVSIDTDDQQWEDITAYGEQGVYADLDYTLVQSFRTTYGY